jgi:hypothetical protein
MKLTKAVIVLAMIFTIAVQAQTKSDYSKEPGFFDYSQYTNLKSGDASTEVYLEEPLLKMVAKMADSKKEGVGKLISNLKLVRVNEFNLEKSEVEKTSSAIESIGKELLEKKWERIIRTKQKNNSVNVFVKPNGDSYCGLVVTMLNNNGKATFVNIVGLIDLESIGKLSEELKIPGLGKVKEEE